MVCPIFVTYLGPSRMSTEHSLSSDSSVRAAKKCPGKQVEYFDSRVPPLALRVSPKGKKTWTMRYRRNDGTQRRLTFGSYPNVSLSAARGLALAALASVAQGSDPAHEKRTFRASARTKKLSTINELLEAYFTDASEGRHRSNGRPKRTTTLEMERSYYERLVRPRFGKTPVVEVTRSEFQRFLDDVGARAPSAARQCRNVVRQAYNYALRRDLVAINPLQFAQTPRPLSRDRVLSDEELSEIWHGSMNPGDVDDLVMSRATGIAICFAMVTLQRGGEVCGLHERELNRATRTWTIPGTRTKNHCTHVVPLSDLALEILDAAFAVAGNQTGFAFPSPRPPNAMTRRAFSRATKRLTTALGIENATPHDFRRTGATVLTGEHIGVTRFIVSRVLNHISDTGGAATATGVYDRNEYLPEKRRALEAWAMRLSTIVGRVAES
jgi:integrase